MPTIKFFEIPADDLERSKKFYSDLFGWKIEKWNDNKSSSNDYFLINTTNENGSPGLGGWIMKRQHPQQMIINFITVPSIDDYASKVEQLGGKILVPKTLAEGHGYFVVCSDTESNHFGIFEENVKEK
ncbi:MAG: VOC family protein [Thermoproteota archaeon]|nr:VOC family protein [Thermoproteota archaeon]